MPNKSFKHLVPTKARVFYREQVQRYRLTREQRANFLFVHINKNGGRSIESALKIPFRHKTAQELRELFGAEEYNKKFVFAFVRNPWSRSVSEYNFRIKTNQNLLGEKPIAFSEWVRKVYAERDEFYLHGLKKHRSSRDGRMPRKTKLDLKHFQPQWKWISDENNELMIDFVGRFERLSDDFNTICTKIGVSATLPHLNATRKTDWRKQYNSYETIQIIAEAFEEDIKKFGYQFED